MSQFGRFVWTQKEVRFTKTDRKPPFSSLLDPKVDVKVLESALKEAIEKEEFEKAAQLRDQIKKLKS